MVRRTLVASAMWCAAIMAAGQTDPYQSVRPLMAGLTSCSDEVCVALSDSIADALESMLQAEDAFESLSSSPDFMAGVASGDGKLRVYTWNWAHEDRTSGYGGLVAFQSKDGDVEFTRLLDLSSADRTDEQQSLKAEDWHGALYYAMVPDAVDKDTWLLLGWDDADAQVTRKVIEPLQIRPRGIRFGAPVLQTTAGLRRRHILEYADAVQASLRYQPEERGRNGHEERIVFDHLGPREPHLSGITAYYGPDMTFDAFIPGKRPGAPWVLKEKTEVSQALPGDRPFVDPRPRNGGRNR